MKIEQRKISDLKLWDRNPRKNDAASEKLAALISEYGFVNPIVCTPDMTVRAGHTRIKAAQKLGLEKVPVIIVDFGSENKARGFAIADNKSHEWAEWDYDILNDVIEDLKTDEFDVGLTGFDVDELGAIDVLKDDLKMLDEDQLKKTKNKCPECGFEW